MKQKTTMYLLGGIVVVLIAAVAYMAYGMGGAIPAPGAVVPTGGGAAPIQPTTGMYTYSSDVRENYNALDCAGAQLNPVLYFYPGTYTSPNWGQEDDFSINAGEYLRTLTLVNGTGSEMWAPGTGLLTLWHLSAYRDLFLNHGDMFTGAAVVPSSGSMTPGDAAGTGFTTTQRMCHLDSTAWTASAIDLGAAGANSTGTKLTVEVTHTVADSNIAQLTRLWMQEFNKSAINKLEYTLSCGIKTTSKILVYDEGSQTDHTFWGGGTIGWQYDSDKYPVDMSAIKNLVCNQQETMRITLDVTADITTIGEAGKLNNTQVLINTLNLYGSENNNLLGQNVTG